ncbi:hypothetical protein NDU88_000881, partial [Pleurodeles waltl]
MRHNAQKILKVLTFELGDIIHPRSTVWIPPQEVADYIHLHIWQGFDKEVRTHLRSECTRPDLPGNVTDTPEVDPTMVTYVKKYAKDTEKGLNRT